MARSEWDSELKPPRAPATPFETETPQRRLLVGVTSLVAAGVVAVAGLLGWQELQIRSITASDARLSTTADGGVSLDTVLLGREGWVYYHARLHGAPTGRRVDITCEWAGPDAMSRDAVDYVTRRIGKAPWPTHCRHRFHPGEMPGTWTVRLYIGERLVSETDFEVAERSG